MADSKHSQFAVVPAIVREIQRIAAKDLCSILKIQPALRKRCGALDRIASDLRLFIVATNKK